MIYINLSQYPRESLSDFMQIAQQAYDAGFPLPCVVVEQVVNQHDILLSRNELVCEKHNCKLQPKPYCNNGYFCPVCFDEAYGG